MDKLKYQMIIQWSNEADCLTHFGKANQVWHFKSRIRENQMAS